MKKMLLSSFGILLNFTAIADENTPVPEPVPAGTPSVVKIPPTPRPDFVFALDENTPGRENIIALVTAIQKEDFEAVKNLLASGLDVNAKDIHHHNTVLMQAASMGKTEVVKLLIEAGADVNFKSVGLTYATGRPTGNYRTPLMMAAQNGHVEIVNLLLAAGADFQAEDWNKKTARDYAAGNNITKQPPSPPSTPEGVTRETALQAKRAEIIVLLDAAEQASKEKNNP